MLGFLLTIGIVVGIWSYVDTLNEKDSRRAELIDLRHEYRKNECFKTDPPSIELCEELQKDIDIAKVKVK